jgi:hypothetical protein
MPNRWSLRRFCRRYRPTYPRNEFLHGELNSINRALNYQPKSAKNLIAGRGGRADHHTAQCIMKSCSRASRNLLDQRKSLLALHLRDRDG